MSAHTNSAGRTKKSKVIAAVTLAVSAGALMLATELPSEISMGAGASSALAELVARSPGMRIGGVALKAKTPRAGISPLAGTGPGPAEATPGTAVASVLGTAVGPEGAVPVIGAIGPGDFPSDFTAPGVPSDIGAPGSSSTDFGTDTGSPGGGLPIFGGAIGGGGGGGGIIGGPGGGTPGTGGPGGTGETGGDTGGMPSPAPVVPGVPEPSVWLMLIAGFGLIGRSMRRERRAWTA